MKSKFYIWIVRILGPVIRFLFRVKHHGLENEPKADEGPYIMICNHISNADPIFLCCKGTRQQPHFMAKKELFKIPILSSLIRGLGAYPVDRGGADVSVIRNSVKMLKEGKSIGIFPQGHREKNKTPMEASLKNGAAMIAVRANATILPCCVKTKNNKFAFFRRIDIYYGKPIPFEELNYDPEAKGEYLRITNYAFSKVVELYKEAEKQEKSRGK